MITALPPTLVKSLRRNCQFTKLHFETHFLAFRCSHFLVHCGDSKHWTWVPAFQLYTGFALDAFDAFCIFISSVLFTRLLSKPSSFLSSSRDTVSILLLCHLFTITWLFGKVVIDGSACEFSLFSACSQGLCRACFVIPTLLTLEAFPSCFIIARPHCQARMIHHIIPARFCDIDCFLHYSNMIQTFCY